MTSLYNPAIHDPLLTEMNQKWNRTDQEIGDALGFDKQLITRHRIRLGLAANYKIKLNRLPPVLQDPKPPKARENPLQVAKMWLGKRLVEKQSGYFLDSVPVNLPQIMKAANRMMQENGAEQIGPEAWRV